MPFRTSIALALFASLALLLVACGDGGDEDRADDGGGDEVALEQTSFTAAEIGATFDPNLQPVIVNSSLGVGPNRISVGIFRSDNSLVLDADVTIRVYRLDEADQGTLVGEYPMHPASVRTESDHVHADGSTHVHNDPFATIYVANVDFDTSGFWGAGFNIRTAEGETFDGVKASKLFVDEDTPDPGIGEPLPRSVTLTLSDVDDISEIDSSIEPVPGMHELTVAQALESGKPVLVAIATPAFCQSRFCGPMVEEVVVPLYERFNEVATFVHVEPFDLAEARAGRLAPIPMLAEWGLRTEPWIFVADRDGNVVAKFEGIASLDEVEAALMAAIETNPDK
jgi:hypothetical protein